MNKKLPGVFANNISNSAAHNREVSYSDKEEVKNENKKIPDNLNINQKINAIFNSPRYVYKADVDIKLKDKIIKKRIIGRNSIHIITIDNELIPISDIVDIDFSE